MGRGEVWEFYPYLVIPSISYGPSYGWYPRPYNDRFWNIVGCILKKLYRSEAPIVAFPGAREESELCDCGGVTGFLGVAVSLPPESAHRLIQEHPDLYAQCACELYPDDEACKKGGERG